MKVLNCSCGIVSARSHVSCLQEIQEITYIRDTSTFSFKLYSLFIEKHFIAGVEREWAQTRRRRRQPLLRWGMVEARE